MSAPVVAFFNNKGGVGKTSLVYHVAWMYAEMGVRVVAADLDPQANLTAAFLDEDRLEELWSEDDHQQTIFGAMRPLILGVGDVADPALEPVTDKLGLIGGDLALSGFEDELSRQWPLCLDRDERAFRVVTAFWRTLQTAARLSRAKVVLVDVGPNLGAINRAAMVAADHIVVPLSPDLFSFQGLRNLGPTLRRWRSEWADRLDRRPPTLGFALPSGQMGPIGYVVLQHSVRLDRPVTAYEKWIGRIPDVYRREVLQQQGVPALTVRDDPNCLAMLRHYRSLMPMAQEARKPIFMLKPADGAIGAHQEAVRRVYSEFSALAFRITEAIAGAKDRQAPPT
jgi:cellulose biosynthesis protein BcsQ